MRFYFLDTSALLKQYRDEPGSLTVHQLFEDNTIKVVISRLKTCLPSAVWKACRLSIPIPSNPPAPPPLEVARHYMPEML